MKYADQYGDWKVGPVKTMNGWRRVGWDETIKHGDCWCHVHSLAGLPHPSTPVDIIGKFYVYDYPGKAAAGYAIEKEQVYGSYEIWRAVDAHEWLNHTRRLPLNRIFSKPLPLP